MRFFAHLTIASTVMLMAFAAGSGQSSQPERSPLPARPIAFTGSYWFQLRPIAQQQDEYARRLRDHISHVFQIPNVDVSIFNPDIVEQELKDSLNHDRNLRRFLYLDHTFPSEPDMVLATPLHWQLRADGSHVWALLTVKQPAYRGDRPRMAARGFVTVSQGRAVFGTLSRQRGPNGAMLQRGHLLDMDEVFDELKMLKLPQWEPS